MNAEASPHVPRAERFSLPVSILYRRAGDVRWREGHTENISRSGVLFRAVEPVDVQMPVEILLDLPAAVAGAAAGASLCHGRIVRHEPDQSAPPAFAAAISDWEALDLNPA
jgi:hypothetical protein